MQTTQEPLFELRHCRRDIRETKKTFLDDTENVGARDEYLVALFLLGDVYQHNNYTAAARKILGKMQKLNQNDLYTRLLEEELSNYN